MMRSSRFVAILGCCLLLAASADARAQAGKKPPPKPDPKAQTQPQWKKGGGKLDPKTSEAKRLFDEGANAYTEGNYEKAIESWEMSYDISKKELICESIANAYERLGKPKQARDYLVRWRAVAPVDERDVLDARVKNLEERIAREEEAEKQLQAEREKREKERKASAATPASGGISIPGIVLAGVGVGAVVTGVVLDVLASKSRPDESVACRPVQDRQICLASEKDAIEGSNKQAFVGDILWIAGSVAGAAGVVLLVTHGLSSSKPKTDAAAFMAAPYVTPTGGGFAVKAQF